MPKNQANGMMYYHIYIGKRKESFLMKKEDFTVGKDVYLLHIRGERNEFLKISKAKVTKIGRRYVWVIPQGKYYELSFDMLENLKQHTPYRPDYKLFVSEEAAKEHVKRINIISSINSERLYLVLNLLTNEELVTIKEIFERAKARKGDQL